MQKTSKRQADFVNDRPRRRGATSNLPEVINIDVLGVMLDEDLITRLRSLEDDKNQAYENHQDLKPWEEEIAYIRREQQVRRTRRDKHSEFVTKAESEFVRSEVFLPAGDFDNSNFVYAASGGRPRWN